MFVRDVLVQSHCVDCGDNDLLLALEFDHIGQKRSTRAGHGAARVLAESASERDWKM